MGNLQVVSLSEVFHRTSLPKEKRDVWIIFRLLGLHYEYQWGVYEIDVFKQLSRHIVRAHFLLIYNLVVCRSYIYISLRNDFKKLIFADVRRINC